MALNAVNEGKANVEFRLFGFIPIRRVAVDVVPRIEVVPGGHSIGVKLRSEGVMVVGYSVLVGKDGREYQPARQAGVEIGDAILSINGEPATSEEQVARLINVAGVQGKTLRLELKRSGLRLEKAVVPVEDRNSGKYVIGLYVRDGAAGVGTLTFYDPRSGKYAALGHVITDADTNRPIDLREGQIVKAVITGIEKGRRAEAGEKIGVFTDDLPLGNIERNTEFGITGSLSGLPENPLFRGAIPVGFMNQVKEGPAKILTVVEGSRIEQFDIEIVRLVRQVRPDGKGMIVKITDPRLLKRTGGIIQGMSGSPIVQDGKLVGAVTHVFVNDPTRGYAVFIEWMLMEAGVFDNVKFNVGARIDRPGVQF